MKETFLAFLGATVRHLLTAAGGAGAFQGLINEDATTAIVSGVIAVAAVIWSYVEKRQRAGRSINMLLVLLIAGTAASLAACGQTAAAQLYASCTTYAGLERELVVRYIEGRLSEASYETMREVAPIAREICRAPDAGKPVGPELLRQLDDAILKLRLAKGDTA